MVNTTVTVSDPELAKLSKPTLPVLDFTPIFDKLEADLNEGVRQIAADVERAVKRDIDAEIARRVKRAERIMGLVHNCIAHPLMGLFPCKWTKDFHNITANALWLI